jgi:hypothetical protein
MKTNLLGPLVRPFVFLSLVICLLLGLDSVRPIRTVKQTRND